MPIWQPIGPEWLPVLDQHHPEIWIIMATSPAGDRMPGQSPKKGCHILGGDSPRNTRSYVQPVSESSYLVLLRYTSTF